MVKFILIAWAVLAGLGGAIGLLGGAGTATAMDILISVICLASAVMAVGFYGVVDRLDGPREKRYRTPAAAKAAAKLAEIEKTKAEGD